MRSIKLGMATVSLLMGSALFLPAQASGDDESCRNNSCNTNVANGGEGGMGGEGGVGVGYGGEANATARAVNNNSNAAHGGNATNRNNIDNSNDIDNRNSNRNDISNEISNRNRNTVSTSNINENENTQSLDNKNLNVQGQKLNNRNYNEDTNTNTNYNEDTNTNTNHNEDTVTNTVRNRNSNDQRQRQGQDQQQDQGQDQGQDQAQSVENVGNVHIENERPPVSTAYAAQLTTGEDTCMGSSSVGAQAVTFGLSFGTTWQDDNCRRLKNSRQLVALGFHRAATALMCVDEDVRAAMIAAGTPCPNGQVAAAVAAPPTRHYVMMAPVADKPRVKQKQRKKHKPLPPK